MPREPWCCSAAPGDERLAARLASAATRCWSCFHVRLLRYDGDCYDVEINFIPGEAECASSSVMGAVHEYAKRLAAEHAISTYFAGMEPARDEDTRYFTGGDGGPLT